MQALRKLLPPALAISAPFALYICSLSQDVGFSDAGEMETVPYILGIAHPVGSPFFTLTGWIFSHLIPFGSIAWRLSLMCSLAMSIAAYATYALALELGVSAYVGVAASWLFAGGPVAWGYATHAELHTFAVMFAMLATTCAVRFRRTGAARVLYAMSVWLGLGLASHPLVSLIIPGLLVIVSPRGQPAIAGAAIRACLIVTACLSLYLYLPLRSTYVTLHHIDPTRMLDLPPGQAFWDYGHPATWQGFKREVLAEDFQASNTVAKLLSKEAYRNLIPMYGQYAKAEYLPFMLTCAIVGMIFLLCEDLTLGIGLTLVGALTIAFAVNYTRVGHIERYFLTSYALIAVYASIGILRALDAIVQNSRTCTILSTSVLAMFASYQTIAHADIFLQRDENAGKQWIQRVRSLTPPNALIIADWDYATPLAYASYVEHGLDQRIVQSAGIKDDRPYLNAWLRKRPVYLAPYTQPFLEGYHFTRIDDTLPPLFRIEQVK